MSQPQIEIEADVEHSDSVDELIRHTIEVALKYLHVRAPVFVTVLLTDDRRIRVLNRDFLGHDSPTDVLSFPAGPAMPGMGDYLGDIAISLPRIQEQANRAGVAFFSELRLIVTHAILHLFGYNHDNPQSKEEMWALQSAILVALGDPPSLGDDRDE